MEKILKICQNILNLFKRKEDLSTVINIPIIFNNEEKITRTIFSPVNVKKDSTLRNNSFTTPAGIDEVSVNRLDFTTPHFVKKISKIIAKPEVDRSYFGIAVINVHEIYQCQSDIVYSPTTINTKTISILNPFHSDIKIGYVKEVGRALPVEYSYKINLLIEKARFYKDDNPANELWVGGILE